MRIVVMGPAGRVGRQIVKEALGRRREFMIVGGVVPAGNEYVRQDIGKATGDGFVGASLYDELEYCIPIAQGVIDFTNPEATMKTIRKCVEYRRPIVIGTTGFTEKQLSDMEYSAKKIPILLGIRPETEGCDPAEYAKDALEAMLFLKGRRKGLYTFQDVINFRNGIEPEEPEEENLFDGGIQLW